MQTILDAAPLSFVAVGRDGLITGWNRHAEIMYGWSREEAIGMPAKLLVPRGDRQAYSVLLQSWLTSEEETPAVSETKQGVNRDGRVFPVALTVSRTHLTGSNPAESNPGHSDLVLFAVDLTETSRLQSELLEGRERYQAIVENIEARSQAGALTGRRSDDAAAETRTERILDLVPLSVITVGCDGRIADWNLEATKAYGWARFEAIGQRSIFNVAEGDREAYGRLLEEWLQPGGEHMFEKPVRASALHRDGHVFPVNLTVLRVCGQNPSLVFFVRDLTERRQLQTDLLESRQRYRAILENIEDGYFEVDRPGNFVFLNEAFCRSFGYSMEEMLGHNYKKFYDAPAIPAIHHAFVSVWETGVSLKSLEYLITRKDGEKRYVEDSVSLKLDRKGNAVGFLGIRRDITERKLSETAVRASETRWRNLFERASDFVYTCDLGGRFTSVNGVGEQLTGYSQQELLGKSTAMLLTPESLAIDLLIRSDLGAGKPVASYELAILTKSGRNVVLEVSVSLLLASGKPTGVMGIARDITARRRAERFERGRGSILEHLARDRPLPDALAEVAAQVEKELTGSACFVGYFEKDEARRNAALCLVHGPSLPDSLKECLSASRGGSWISEGNASLETLDIERHPLWDSCREEALASGWRGCWSAPILSGMGEGIGRLSILRPDKESPDRDERDFLAKAAELASLAIEHCKLAAQLAFQAKHDSLTGLPNRLLFEERLDQAIAAARQRGSLIAIIWLDLDRFKNINDTLGHWVGDLLLLEVTKRFLARVSGENTLARLGGDEFAIVMTGAAGIREDASLLAGGLLKDLERAFPVSGHTLQVTASIGISVFPADGADAAALLRSADQAMYSAKHKEHGQCHFYSPEMGQQEAEKADIEKQLRAGLLHGGFEVHYQPQFAPAGDLIALEALLRFRHPALGLIPPGRFIPVAEESGLIIPIGQWVLREVCRQGVEWEKRGYPPVRLAVNVSALQFAQTDFAEMARLVLAETGMPGNQLELELTETVVMSNVAESIRQMRQLRALGVSIAIDDFGTGYSSLNYLHRLEVDRLKIDRSFVMDLDSAVTTLPVVQAILALARSLKQEVVAEGVETVAQLRMLQNAGCDLLQGYLLARPVPAEVVENLFGAPLPAWGAVAARKSTLMTAGRTTAGQLHSLIRGMESAEVVQRKDS